MSGHKRAAPLGTVGTIAYLGKPSLESIIYPQISTDFERDGDKSTLDHSCLIIDRHGDTCFVCIITSFNDTSIMESRKHFDRGWYWEIVGKGEEPKFSAYSGIGGVLELHLNSDQMAKKSFVGIQWVHQVEVGALTHHKSQATSVFVDPWAFARIREVVMGQWSKSYIFAPPMCEDLTKVGEQRIQRRQAHVNCVGFCKHMTKEEWAQGAELDRSEARATFWTRIGSRLESNYLRYSDSYLGLFGSYGNVKNVPDDQTHWKMINRGPPKVVIDPVSGPKEVAPSDELSRRPWEETSVESGQALIRRLMAASAKARDGDGNLRAAFTQMGMPDAIKEKIMQAVGTAAPIPARSQPTMPVTNAPGVTGGSWISQRIQRSQQAAQSTTYPRSITTQRNLNEAWRPQQSQPSMLVLNAGLAVDPKISYSVMCR